MDDLFERHGREDSSKEEKPGIYYFQSEKQLPSSILEEIEYLDQPDIMVEIDGLIENKKWKSYLNKDQFLVLNDNEKLVWSNGSETHTGSWEYMSHSSLLLFNFIQPGNVQHLVYQVLHCSEEILVLKPQHAKGEEDSAFYEVYYHGRKPSQSRIQEMLLNTGGTDNKEWLIYLTAAILLVLLVLYFMIIY